MCFDWCCYFRTAFLRESFDAGGEYLPSTEIGVALIDEVCRPYNLSDADVSEVKNRLVERGYVTNVAAGIVAITAEGINRASQFFC
jgi:hypothetical protein